MNYSGLNLKKEIKHICENTIDRTFFEMFSHITVCGSWWRGNQSRVKLRGERGLVGVLHSGIAARREVNAVLWHSAPFQTDWATPESTKQGESYAVF